MRIVENPQPGSSGARPLAAIFEYSRPAFYAIQEAVLAGCGKSPKGREERAGVLYGTREGNIIRVQLARRIACEHTRGRALLLSVNDRAALKEQLAREATEPALQGLMAIGWFLSHAAPIRTAMTATGTTVLGPPDLETFDEYFGTAGQVTLVLRPHSSGTMHASVFARRADGSVNPEDSDLNFPFTEAAAFPDRTNEVERKPPQRAAPAVRETALAAAAATAVSSSAARQTAPTRISACAPLARATTLAPDVPVKEVTSTPASLFQPRIPEPEPAGDPRASAKPSIIVTPAAPVARPAGHEVIRAASAPGLKLYPNFGSYSDPAPRFSFEFAKRFDGMLGIGGLALLAGLASMPLGVKYYSSLSESAPIALTISEHNNQIQVRWNHSSRAIREAAQGSIDILDGSESRSAVLSADDLLHGSVIYVSQTGDVQIRLEVENAKGQKTQEMTHFIEPHANVGDITRR